MTSSSPWLQSCIVEQGKHQTKVGLICTGDQFMYQAGRDRQGRADFPQMLAVEMEGPPSARYAHVQGALSGGARHVRHIAGKEQVESFDAFIEVAGQHSAEGDHGAARQAVIDTIPGDALMTALASTTAAIMVGCRPCWRSLPLARPFQARRHGAAADPPSATRCIARTVPFPVSNARRGCWPCWWSGCPAPPGPGVQPIPSEPLFDLLFLLLMLGITPLRELAWRAAPWQRKRRWWWREVAGSELAQARRAPCR